MQFLIDLSDSTVRVFEQMIADVPPARMTEQFPGIPNHPAWQVGHLSMIRAAVAGMLNAPADPGVSMDRFAAFARGSTPVADPAAYPDKDDLLATFRAAHARAMKAIRNAPAEVLDGPHPMGKPFQALFPTMRHMLHALLTFHEGLHMGQLGTWRSAAGLPRVL